MEVENQPHLNLPLGKQTVLMRCFSVTSSLKWAYKESIGHISYNFWRHALIEWGDVAKLAPVQLLLRKSLHTQTISYKMKA